MPGFLEKEGHPSEKGTHLIPLALHFPQNNKSQSTVLPGYLQILFWISRPRGNKGSRQLASWHSDQHPGRGHQPFLPGCTPFTLNYHPTLLLFELQATFPHNSQKFVHTTNLSI